MEDICLNDDNNLYFASGMFAFEPRFSWQGDISTIFYLCIVYIMYVHCIQTALTGIKITQHIHIQEVLTFYRLFHYDLISVNVHCTTYLYFVKTCAVNKTRVCYNNVCNVHDRFCRLGLGLGSRVSKAGLNFFILLKFKNIIIQSVCCQ